MKANSNERNKGIIALAAFVVLFLLTLLLLFLCPVEARGAVFYLLDGPIADTFYIGLISLFISLVCAVFTVLSIIKFFTSKDNRFRLLRTGALINFMSATLVCIVSTVSDLQLYPLVFLIIAIALFRVVSACGISTKSPQTISQPATADGLEKNITGKGQNFVSTTLVWISLIALLLHSFVLLYMPLAAGSTTQVFSGTGITIPPSVINIFSYYVSYDSIYQYFSIGFVALMIANCIFFLNLILRFFVDTAAFLKGAKRFAIYNITLTIVLMLFSLVRMLLSKIAGQEVFFVTYINVLIAYAVYVVFVIFAGRATEKTKAITQKSAVIKARRKSGLSELICVGLMTAITFSMFFLKLYTMNINAPAGATTISNSPYDIMMKLSSQSVMEIAAAFLLILLCIMSALLLIFTILNYIVDSEDYRNSALQYVYANLFFQFIYLMVGLFFMIMVPAFDSIFQLVLSNIIGDISLLQLVDIKTLAFIPFLAGLLVIIYMQLFCLRRKKPSAVTETDNTGGQNLSNKNGQNLLNPPEPAADSQNVQAEFDHCPAFSDLDSKIDVYKEELGRLRSTAFPNPTLQSLTEFVVNFAANSPERLSYTQDSIATFIAGLGASRLSILQGMSGTGKTSLPKVFMQALGGKCEIVEVESSWRDRNELLGYYNEFNGIYSPKKFTQYLYKAALNPEIPTFIVLDEMNLSRIEYYFSDFLSVMEAREEQRTVNLMNTLIYPPCKEPGAGEKQSSYLALTDGNTIRIPPNVWFIGTANRDESTFEISDKVYDRAQTMNFDRRAPKITSDRLDVSALFLEYDKLKELFEAAKQAEFNAESDPRILAVEKLLLPYKISFGNRILNQIERFVKVYLACCDISTPVKYELALHHAVENILYSKVLRKLELKVVEDKEQLARDFESLHLNLCTQFIRQLNDN